MSRERVPSPHAGAPRPSASRRGCGWRWWTPKDNRWTTAGNQNQSGTTGGTCDDLSAPNWYQQTVTLYPVQVKFNRSVKVINNPRYDHFQVPYSSAKPKYKCSSTWNKIVLLTWKNALLQIRKPCKTAMEIIMPLLSITLLLLLRMLIAPESKNAQSYRPFCPLQWSLMCDELTSKDSAKRDEILIYSPTGNSGIDKAMGFFKSLYSNVQSHATEKDLETWHYNMLTSKSLNSTIVSIVFDDYLIGGTQVPDDTEVRIRFPAELARKPKYAVDELDDWRTNKLFPETLDPGPRLYQSNFGAVPAYHAEGFLRLQTMLTYFLIYSQLGATKFDDFKTITNDQKHTAPKVKMQRFPHAKWISDPINPLMTTLLGLALILGFYFTFNNTVTAITVEKETQLKETMKMMGLSNWIHWTAWFIKSFVFLFISIVLIVILLSLPVNEGYGVFTYGNPHVVFVFLLLVACSIITLAFMTSVFFSKASKASTFAAFFLVITYVPYLFLQNTSKSLTYTMLACLGCGSAMAFGVRLMLELERIGRGIQWNNIFRSDLPDDNLTLGHVMLMLIVDTFLYLFIALYVEAVFPGDYGVPLPWNYLFTRAYWKREPFKSLGQYAPGVSTAGGSKHFEKEPTLEAGVQIKNLWKVFGNNAAVRNLSLNMYRDQITVLLGHNGAGKTTTMSMLTGMFPPTSGTATVAGHDIRTDMEGVRLSLGLCPQHNILFDDLTVREHLIFFTRLKGLKKTIVDREVKTYIHLMELGDKADKKSSTLSGGMKRKLCVGIAMCGHSEVVMLDEPTAGMDPSARRSIWELIQKQKDGRTVLLTTHFMDEADLLGDRIAIMAGGELQCCGSSFFLKKKYGTGYHLIIDKADNCNPANITRMLKIYISSVEIHSNVGSELTYFLAEDQADVFEAMLGHLEDHSHILRVRSYGISLTTLEEVFMKVGADHGQTESYNTSQKLGDKLKKSLKIDGVPKTKASNRLLSGCKLTRNQFSAMCTKRFLSQKRNWMLLLVQLLLPFFCTIHAFVDVSSQSKVKDLPKLPLSLKPYDRPITLIENAADAKTTGIHQVYVDLLTESEEKMEKVGSIPEVMMNYTDKAPAKMKKRYIIGVSFSSPKQTGQVEPAVTVTAWFNNEPYHSPPLALGMALGSVYKYMLKKRIRFANHPLPFTENTKLKQLSQRTATRGSGAASELAFALAFVSGLQVLFYVRERACKSKHLQLVSGVKIYIFWLCAFICDLAIYLVIFLVIIVTIACFRVDGYKTPSDLGRIFLVLLYYVVAVLPLIYLASFWSDVPSTVLGILVLIFVLIGVFVFTTISLMDAERYKWIGILHMALLIEPHYSLATGIKDIHTTYSLKQMCSRVVTTCSELHLDDHCREFACETMKACCGIERDRYFKWQSPGIGKNLCYSFGIGTTMFLLLLMKDYRCCSRLASVCPKRAGSYVVVPDEDSDVEDEKQKIRTTDARILQNAYTIVLRNVTKYYGRKFLAVNGICLGIRGYECFGLLGVNGAGKTTTFQMMTGDAKMTRGDVWINGFNIAQQRSKAQENIGYCPQFDALLDDMTAKETLVMFALLRGVPKRGCANLAEKLAADFDFKRHLNKQIKTLSGGNKRKISTAIAMIGDPPVVFLDEPTAGMDPATRRHLWNVLCRARDQGKCIVLTSHSMEECEALCTRLVIMVRGDFKCLGSAQHLKSKFATGYTLTIKVKKMSQLEVTRATQLVEDFVKDNFSSAVLREKHQELLTYNIVDKSVPWSKMFGVLQKAKGDLAIEDYSLGQSSLEQVFLTFTRNS